jgi:hypothetical protein
VLALLVDFAHQQRQRQSGYRRAWDDLTEVYGPINRTRVQRLWRLARLQVPRR